MKKSEIRVGTDYANGKKIRKVIDIGNYPLYPGQQDRDDVKYLVVDDGTKDNRKCGIIGVMTKVSFANWAKEIVEVNHAK
jgi:hypothetical protein